MRNVVTPTDTVVGRHAIISRTSMLEDGEKTVLDRLQAFQEINACPCGLS